MAESREPLQTDYFNIGSTVWCRTCHNDDVKGEVLAFDPQAKMLILKSPGSADKPNMPNINIVNLSLVRDLKVKRECTDPPPQMDNLNVNRLTRRLRENVEEKKRLIAAMEHGVSPEGQSLFLAISKTLSEVRWSGTDLIVMNEVSISAPYQPEDVKKLRADSKAFPHVRKIVEKHAVDHARKTSKPPPSSPPAVAGGVDSSASSASSCQPPGANVGSAGKPQLSEAASHHQAAA